MDQSRRSFFGLAGGAAAAQALGGTHTAEIARADVPVRRSSGYRIHPAIGVARMGDSGSDLADPFAEPSTFYLAPEAIGGLPTEYVAERPSAGAPVQRFKDQAGQVRRQAARFRVYRDDASGGSVPVSLDDPEIASIRWTVHVANKKAAWYEFSEFQGNLMLGAENSYAATGVPLRNAVISKESERRRRLIIDPGPRSVDHPSKTVRLGDTLLNDERPGAGYDHVSFPGPSGISAELGFENTALYPYAIDCLGHIAMDVEGGLMVLGGHGCAGGPKAVGISSYAGADGFFDDASDGSVRAEITLRSGEVVHLDAWVVSAPPKVAPELVNISTLDDIVYDMAVRHKGAAPEIFDRDGGVWNDEFIVDYDREIAPVLARMRSYQWVADVAPMIAFATPSFDPSDNRNATRDARRRWLSYLRDPGTGEAWEITSAHQQLTSEDGFPLMPLNSGSNPVSNQNISKFVALTPTQYFFFRQWAEGRFERSGPRRTAFTPNAVDRAAIGNCVGAPMSPGIEVTWSTRNPALYRDDDPYRIDAQPADVIAERGLSSTRDETEGGGCQPGDLTKRMSIPWQADLFLCGAQPISFRDPLTNKTPAGSNTELLPPPPTFRAFWWPPQSPVLVYSGAAAANAQTLDGGIALGERARYLRGVNTFLQAVIAWRYLGFIANLNTGPHGSEYPFFAETERDFVQFRAVKVEFSESGVLRTDATTETVGPRRLTRHARPLHYYVGRE